MNKQKQGFTLVELIVVITILAILGTIAIMAFSGYSKNARDSARISDIGNMKKSLELWILQSGTYPDPTTPIEITYSGSALVWTQGTFGDSVTNTVGKLDKKPVDPLYTNEYTYSVTALKKEYQIGAVLEKDMASNVIFAQTYAATTGEAYVSGTYNGILTTVGSNPIYMIALPSIIISDTTLTDLKNVSTNLVYEGQTNLPSSYKVTGLTMTGTAFSFTPTVVWSGSSLAELNTQTGFQDMVTNLQTIYKTEPLFASLPEYTSIVSGDTTPSVATMSFVKGLVETNTNYELTNVNTVATVPNSCNTILPACNGVGCQLTYEAESQNQVWVKGGSSCGFECTGGYFGDNCEIAPPTSIIGDDTLGRTYNNGTYALSCNDYKNSTAYTGSIGNGYYQIDIDGTGSIQPYKAFCNMTIAGGGWTRVYKTTNSNINTTTFSYDGELINLVSSSTLSLISIENTSNSFIYSASFQTPNYWKTNHPLSNPGQMIMGVTVTNPTNNSTVTGNIIYGYNYNRSGCYSQYGFTGLYGGICVEGASFAPFYEGYASSDSDICDNNAGWRNWCSSSSYFFAIYVK